jgi:hypothetical protein
MLIYTHCWELMNSVGSHGSLSLPFLMKVMVCHFVSDSHEVMTALIVVLPLIVVVEISLQLHQSFMFGIMSTPISSGTAAQQNTIHTVYTLCDDNQKVHHLLPSDHLLCSDFTHFFFIQCPRLLKC